MPMNVTGQALVDQLKSAVQRASQAQQAAREAATRLVAKPPPPPPGPSEEAR